MYEKERRDRNLTQMYMDNGYVSPFFLNQCRTLLAPYPYSLLHVLHEY